MLYELIGFTLSISSPKVHRTMLSRKPHYPPEETSLHQRVSPPVHFVWEVLREVSINGLADFRFDLDLYRRR